MTGAVPAQTESQPEEAVTSFLVAAGEEQTESQLRELVSSPLAAEVEEAEMETQPGELMMGLPAAVPD